MRSTPGSQIVRSRIAEDHDQDQLSHEYMRSTECFPGIDRTCDHHSHCVPNISSTPMFRPFHEEEPVNYDIGHTVSPVNFDIEIVQKGRNSEASSFTKNGHRYHRLKHKSEYSVKMSNNTSSYVNALLKIDSDTMGKWRIHPYASIEIERPVHNSRRFVFVEEASDEAREGGVRQGMNSASNGLVEVTFIPMIDNRPLVSQKRVAYSGGRSNALMNSRGLKSQYTMDALPQSMRSEQPQDIDSYGAGATVLGDDSNQQFGQAPRQFEEDTHGLVVRRVRLVVDKRKDFASIRERETDDRIVHQDPIPPKMGFEHLYG